MSKRPSANLRKDCNNAQSCDKACNYLVMGAELAGLAFARRLNRNNVRGQISVITQGGNRTSNEGISRPSYPVINLSNAKQNLAPIIIQHINARDASDSETSDSDFVPFDLTETRTTTHYVPTGVIGGTLGSYMITRVGRWDYELSGQTLVRIFQFLREFAVPVEFNTPNKQWAKRVAKLNNIPLVSGALGVGPGILDHTEIFLKPTNILGDPFNIDGLSMVQSSDNTDTEYSLSSDNESNGFIREIGLSLYRRVVESNINVKSSARNIQLSRTNTPGLFDVTVDNVKYPNSKISFKLNPLLKLKLASRSGLGRATETIPAEYRIKIPIPANGRGFSNSDFYNKLWKQFKCMWSDSTESCGCKSPKSDICYCDTSDSGTGSSESINSGIDFSSVTPDADLIYANIGFTMDSPVGCNRTLRNNNNKPRWNIQSYITSEDIYDLSPGGSFSQDGSLFLIVDGQDLANRRRITYDTNGDEVNLFFNSNITERASVNEFATIASNIILSVTGVKIPPKALYKTQTVCSTSGECDIGSLITNTPDRQSNMAFFLETVALLYNNNSTITI